MPIVIDVIVFIGGLVTVLLTLLAAMRTFVLPRGDNVWLTSKVFRLTFRLFRMRLKRKHDFAEIDRILALFAPSTMFILPLVWMLLVTAGFTAMFWAIGVRPIGVAFLLSGSSLLTLGFAPVANLAQTALAFSAATIGLGLIALLIAYLPTMYAAFSHREAAVTLLDVRAGAPPSAITMIKRYNRIHNLTHLHDQWVAWEVWFGELEESHTTFAALSFFRSPQPQRSWVTASGAILDAAALAASTLDIPRDPSADLCLRAGFLALRRITDFFRLPYNPDPHPNDPISISRADFDAACADMERDGVPLKADRDQAWRDFAGWRVNYDDVLITLAKLTVAPPSPWTGDRVIDFSLPKNVSGRK
jgi:hypothetical protein